MANLWDVFLGLIPKDAKVIGTIIEDLGGARYTVQLIDGGLLTAIAPQVMTLNQRVFVQGGTITGQAPNLPAVTLDI